MPFWLAHDTHDTLIWRNGRRIFTFSFLFKSKNSQSSQHRSQVFTTQFNILWFLLFWFASFCGGTVDKVCRIVGTAKNVSCKRITGLSFAARCRRNVLHFVEKLLLYHFRYCFHKLSLAKRKHTFILLDLNKQLWLPMYGLVMMLTCISLTKLSTVSREEWDLG